MIEFYMFLGVVAALGSIEAAYKVGWLAKEFFARRFDVRTETALAVAGLFAMYALYAAGIGGVLAEWQFTNEWFSSGNPPYPPGDRAFIRTLLFRLSAAIASAGTLIIVWRYFQFRPWFDIGVRCVIRFALYIVLSLPTLL